MYRTIFAQLSKESRHRVRRDPNWDETEASQDPLRLWVIIGAIHRGAGVGVPLVDQLVAQKNYQTVPNPHRNRCSRHTKVEMVVNIDPHNLRRAE